MRFHIICSKEKLGKNRELKPDHRSLLITQYTQKAAKIVRENTGKNPESLSQVFWWPCLGILPHHIVTTQVPPPRCWWKSCGDPWSTWFGYTFRTRSATIDSWRLGGTPPNMRREWTKWYKTVDYEFFFHSKRVLDKYVMRLSMGQGLGYHNISWLCILDGSAAERLLLDSVGKNLRKVHARATWLDHIVYDSGRLV